MSDRGKEDWVKRKRGNQGLLDSPLASKVFASLFAIMASYMGYEKVEEYRASQGSVESTVNVNIESVPDSVGHSHAAVVSRTAINALIAKAIADQHDKDLKIFKQKESWE